MVNSLDDTATGTIQFEPVSEFSGEVLIEAWNTGYLDFKGDLSPRRAASASIKVNAVYPKLTFTPQLSQNTGIFTIYDSSTGMILLGDGEACDLTFSCDQQNSSPVILSVVMNNIPNNSGVSLVKNGTAHSWRLSSATDVLGSPGNQTITRLFNCGTLVITYSHPGSYGSKVCNIPVYYTERKCDITGN
jgi:hypothetical protein